MTRSWVAVTHSFDRQPADAKGPRGHSKLDVVDATRGHIALGTELQDHCKVMRVLQRLPVWEISAVVVGFLPILIILAGFFLLH